MTEKKSDFSFCPYCELDDIEKKTILGLLTHSPDAKLVEMIAKRYKPCALCLKLRTVGARLGPYDKNETPERTRARKNLKGFKSVPTATLKTTQAYISFADYLLQDKELLESITEAMTLSQAIKARIKDSEHKIVDLLERRSRNELPREQANEQIKLMEKRKAFQEDLLQKLQLKTVGWMHKCEQKLAENSLCRHLKI